MALTLDYALCSSVATHRLEALGLALLASDGIARIHAIHFVVDERRLRQPVLDLRGEKDAAGAGHRLLRIRASGRWRRGQRVVQAAGRAGGGAAA